MVIFIWIFVGIEIEDYLSVFRDRIWISQYFIVINNGIHGSNSVKIFRQTECDWIKEN